MTTNNFPANATINLLPALNTQHTRISPDIVPYCVQEGIQVYLGLDNMNFGVLTEDTMKVNDVYRALDLNGKLLRHVGELYQTFDTIQAFVKQSKDLGVKIPLPTLPMVFRRPSLTPSECQALENYIRAMVNKLNEGKAKGKPGWQKDSVRDLWRHLEEEVRELKTALESTDNSQILREAADVANMAMMVADVANRKNSRDDVKTSTENTP